MTSSLVGSEMCIRDSCRNDPAPARSPTTATHTTTRTSGKLLAAPRTAPCLLYTSDAADDM
eukprot:11895999-Prorocentrum_lima.AAC.1